MPTTRLNDIGLFHTTSGTGAPLVVVHGSWSDQRNWAPAIPLLAERFRVIAYDRRGHGSSERPDAAVVTRREHEDDLAAVIEALAGEPAHVVANSYGAMVGLGLAARRPELIRSVCAHEPAVVSVAEQRDDDGVIAEVRAAFEAVRTMIRAGEVEDGTRHFVERVAMGPGAWELLPERVREVFLFNAPAFAADFADPAWDRLDLDAVRRSRVPVLLTKGDGSPPWLGVVADRVGELLHGAPAKVIAGAGHSPHMTLAGPYAELVASYCGREPVSRAA